MTDVDQLVGRLAEETEVLGKNYCEFNQARSAKTEKL
jgi:hypothetical protein